MISDYFVKGEPIRGLPSNVDMGNLEGGESVPATENVAGMMPRDNDKDQRCR